MVKYECGNLLSVGRELGCIDKKGGTGEKKLTKPGDIYIKKISTSGRISNIYLWL